MESADLAPRAAAPGASRTDAELALAWGRGDAAAFDEVYRRHSRALFGTAVGLVRDHAGAGDVVHDTFVRAATHVEGLRDPSRLRAWLFAILRNEAVSWHRSRSRIAGGLDDGPVPMSEQLADNAAGPDVEASRRELADLVWTAADGLQPRDREVLELHLRGGLEAIDLAPVMGVSPAHAAVLLSRMRDRLERCLGAVLIAQLGRADCTELDRLLDGWDGRFSLAVRGSVVRHVESCRTCGRRRATLVSLEKLMPAVVPPVVALPEELHTRLVSALYDDRPSGLPPEAVPATVGPIVAEPWSWRPDGFPWPVEPVEPVAADPPTRNRGPVGLLVGALALVIAVVIGLRALTGDTTATLVAEEPSRAAFPSLASSQSGSAASGTAPGAAGAVADPDGSAAGQPGPTGFVSDPATTLSTPPGPSVPFSISPRASTAATPGPTVTPTPSRTADPTPAPSTPSTPSPRPSTDPASPSPSTVEPPRILRVAVSPDEVAVTAAGSRCTNTTATVNVAVAARGEVSGTLTWPTGQGRPVTVPVKGSGSVLTGSVGPFETLGTVTIGIRVRDVDGQVDTATTSVVVSRCIDL